MAEVNLLYYKRSGYMLEYPPSLGQQKQRSMCNLIPFYVT